MEALIGTVIILGNLTAAMIADDLTRHGEAKMKWREHVNEDLIIWVTVVLLIAIALIR